MAKVLCTGWDKNLLDTRTMLLESAGFEVRQARSQKEVAAECGQQQFDVAVIGQTVSDRMKRLVAAMVRESCRDIRILELYQPHLGKAVEDADAWLAVPTDVPDDLPQHVSKLLEKPVKQHLRPHSR